MESNTVKFGQIVTVAASPLLGRPEPMSGRVVERCFNLDYFRVVLSDGQRETIHASDLQPV